MFTSKSLCHAFPRSKITAFSDIRILYFEIFFYRIVINFRSKSSKLKAVFSCISAFELVISPLASALLNRPIFFVNSSKSTSPDKDEGRLDEKLKNKLITQRKSKNGPDFPVVFLEIGKIPKNR